MRSHWMAASLVATSASVIAATALAGPLADRLRASLGWVSSALLVVVVLFLAGAPPVWIAMRWGRARARLGKAIDRTKLHAGVLTVYNLLALVTLVWAAPPGTWTWSRLGWLFRQASPGAPSSPALASALTPRELWRSDGTGRAAARDMLNPQTDELVFAAYKPGHEDSELVALELRTGKVRWQTAPPEPPGSSAPTSSEHPFFRPSLVTVLGDIVLFQTVEVPNPRAVVTAFGVADGQKKWSMETTDLDCSLAAAHVRSGVVVGRCGHGVLAVELTTRRRLWQAGKPTEDLGWPSADDQRAYFLAKPSQHDQRGEARLSAVDLHTGAPVWSVELEGAPSLLHLHERHIVVVGRETVGVASETGVIVWRHEAKSPESAAGNRSLLRVAPTFAHRGRFFRVAPGGFEAVLIATGTVERTLDAPVLDDKSAGDWSFQLVDGNRDEPVGWLEKRHGPPEAYIALYERSSQVVVRAPGNLQQLAALSGELLVMSGRDPAALGLTGYALR